MRDIKFRGIDKHKKWHYGFLWKSPDEKWWIKEAIEKTHSADFEVIEESIAQYTGLKDKNGKEIYEGDICKRKLDKENRFRHFEEWADFWLIEWLDTTCGFTTTYLDNLVDRKLNQIKLRQNSFSQRFNEMDEVIGNIYENPELLNEKER